MRLLNFTRLKKELSLFDVYVIATAAMIGSGFFLLPGIATSYTGPSVVLAYGLAGLLIIPAMLSQAELATAMPRAGGAYYFLDRTLGPLMGTIGGVGTWLTLVLKSAFALIGMGAYLALVLDIPMEQTAIAFTVVFGLLNVLGARQ
jgi:amino acid transporter